MVITLKISHKCILKPTIKMNQFKNLLLKTVLKNQSGFNSIKRLNVIFFKKLIMSNTEIQSKIDELNLNYLVI